jgi:ribosomal protein S18 acetylase RimI-like enzyme
MEIESEQEYKEDIFEPINDKGKLFNQFEEYYGITMICINPRYRGKGLAKKLIIKHFDDNKNMTLCLNTRRSNINAYQLYKKMGYEQIAFIKNKYFLPSEDSVFMIKN